MMFVCVCVWEASVRGWCFSAFSSAVSVHGFTQCVQRKRKKIFLAFIFRPMLLRMHEDTDPQGSVVK